MLRDVLAWVFGKTHMRVNVNPLRISGLCLRCFILQVFALMQGSWSKQFCSRLFAWTRGCCKEGLRVGMPRDVLAWVFGKRRDAYEGGCLDVIPLRFGACGVVVVSDRLITFPRRQESTGQHSQDEVSGWLRMAVLSRFLTVPELFQCYTQRYSDSAWASAG
jgi:hypothetical protein